MITPLVILSWLIYGIVILFLMAIWFILIYAIFRNRKTSEVASSAIILFWVIPVSLFLGFLVYFAAQHLILLDLIK